MYFYTLYYAQALSKNPDKNVKIIKAQVFIHFFKKISCY